MKETNRIECKKELNDSLEKEMVGFLNYFEGGEIYIGIDDHGNVLGIENVDEVQRKIVDRIKNNIYPSTLGLFDVRTVEMEEKDIIKIVVSSGPEKPYCIKKYGMSPKGCFIRVGTTVQPMPMEMIDTLYSKRTRNSLGRIVSPRQDLTFKLLKIYYHENGFETNDMFLQNLELYTEENKFNYAAYLLADVNGVSMKVAKYSSIDKVDLIEIEEYGYTSILKATENILNKLEIENKTLATITSSTRKESRLVEPAALREAIINAIIHNDYSNGIPPVVEIFPDRIVITSSGGLPQELSQEEFYQGISAPRNKELMRIFKDVKLVEQLGSGIKRILRSYDKDIFSFFPNFLQVSFPINVTGNVTGNVTINVTDDIILDELKNQILKEIKRDSYITQDKISKNISKSKRTVIRSMKEMQEINIIKRIGSNKKGSWQIIENNKE